MSAAEIIKQIAALPPHERVRFEQLLRSMESSVRSSVRAESKPVWPDFAERLRGIYGDAVVPDSQALIDEERGTI